MPEKMIALNISDEQLRDCDVSAIERNFGQQIEPKMAKLAYGRIYLVFPKYDNDPREVWEIDEVRLWLQRLAVQVPHFPFFLVPDARAAQFSMYFMSLIEIQRDSSSQIVIDLNAAALELGRINHALKDFCGRVRENYPTVSSKLFEGLPEPLQALLK